MVGTDREEDAIELEHALEQLRLRHRLGVTLRVRQSSQSNNE
eukprot:COSAG06_NODE_39049_length_417_cov_0.588050_2_plen_41_part_01